MIEDIQMNSFKNYSIAIIIHGNAKRYTLLVSCALIRGDTVFSAILQLLPIVCFTYVKETSKMSLLLCIREFYCFSS